MIFALFKAREQSRYGKGKSKAAARRRETANRGTLHTGEAGQIVKMSGASYFVAKDGSFRRIPAIALPKAA